MADITMCKGEMCANKEKCYRFTAPANPYWQSYYIPSPIKNGHCDEFWDNSEYRKKEKRNG